MRIAALDDDPHQLAALALVLKEAGFSFKPYSTAREFLTDIRRESFDAVLLDWVLGDSSTGLEVVKAIRAIPEFVRLPVLFMTVKDEERDVVEALTAGADDFLNKPIRGAELVARIKATTRRMAPISEDSKLFEADRFKFDLRLQQCWSDGVAIDLTQKEFNLAMVLLQNVGRALSRGYLLERVWGRETEVPSRTMDTHISRVRTRLDLRPERGYLLSPVYSYGYRLEKL
jgi:DNA-binding response OmpR family regulator